ncbi:hypothetical protein [Tsukamurella soli]|uniref:Uncharacterized protein n=1 Tax=Tsukamurella soli TaxID=644556 RepID=A0ABP8JCW8_9ACTN
MHAIAHWWDTVELWLSSLPYVPQVLIMLIALLLIAILIVRVLTALIDRLADALHGPTRVSEPDVQEETTGDSPGEGI